MSDSSESSGGPIICGSSSESDESTGIFGGSPNLPRKKARVSVSNSFFEKKPERNGSAHSGSTVSARKHAPAFRVKPMSEAVRNAKKYDAKLPTVDLRENDTAGQATFDAKLLTNKFTAHASDSSSKDEDASKDEDVEPVEVVRKYVKLEDIIDTASQLSSVRPTDDDIWELEKALQLDTNGEGDGWRDDWSGNLALAFANVPNPESTRFGDQFKPFVDWAPTSAFNERLFKNFLAHIHGMKSTPLSAKRLLRWAYTAIGLSPRENVKEIIRRIFYDPTVLREDGWEVTKSPRPEGSTGGSYRLGTKLIWQGYEAVVIAFVNDPDIGDMWKALWFEDNETFDVEALELESGVRRWKRKFAADIAPSRDRRESSRYADVSKFTVGGIEHGIVLAQSYAKNARHGVLWPARIMHVSEEKSGLQSKRSSTRQKIYAVFLAPYWNAVDEFGQPLANSFSRNHNIFSAGALVEVDQVEISDETIQQYPESEERGLNIDRLRASFRFTGLPKSAFSRFLDSHRFALALKVYAREELTSNSYTASAALLDTHPLSIQAAQFPPEVLDLPFQYILSRLPPPAFAQSGSPTIEPAIDLACILKGMEPPICWGLKGDQESATSDMADILNGHWKDTSPCNESSSQASRGNKVVSRAGGSSRVTVDNVSSAEFKREFSRFKENYPVSQLLGKIDGLVAQLWSDDVADSASSPVEWTIISTFLRDCLLVKGHGEDIIGSLPGDAKTERAVLMREWRSTCERLYREASCQFSSAGFGNGATVVISDSRCNEHITVSGAFERPVRLPAALKGSRLAKAQLKNGALHILPRVKDSYMEAAKRVIPKAHSNSYIERMKQTCSGLAPEAVGQPLTDNSDGDTTGSRGSFTAALAGVAAAIKGVDMIVGGQCVNVFCATRPPGHHAGRQMHPMKATSNGFCILNPAACAALYAATPVAEGGMGLRRVCVIDFDVHHGNGTQDILCSTDDPRFLYVSLHAGGAQYNGFDAEDDSEVGYRSSVGSTSRGIFPGRCGDTSPHRGVLNIPLGGRFTAIGVGSALVSKVTPSVEEFSPDLIVLSAGFDGHKFDPLRLGGLSAEDYGHITKVACDMAHALCGGRVLSVLEGGYGVPCCRPQEDLFLPNGGSADPDDSQLTNDEFHEKYDSRIQQMRPQPKSFADLVPDLPSDMDDQVTWDLQNSLEKCSEEGFVECVKEHVAALGTNNRRISTLSPRQEGPQGDAGV